MSRMMLPLLLCLAWLCAEPASARTQASQSRVLQARISRIDSAVVTLQRVRVRLDWPEGAPHGQLAIDAGEVDAPDLGYRFRDLHWQCPLQRDGHDGWRCDGLVRGTGGKPMQLSLDLASGSTDIALAQGNARLAVHRIAASPDDTGIDLTRVPLAWAQALLAQAWSAGQLQAGTLDGKLRVHTPGAAPLQVAGTLDLAGAGFDTPDASIAGQGLGGRFAIDYRSAGKRATIELDGSLRGGEFLAGDAYIALPDTPVALNLQARRQADGGWRLPAFGWHDGQALRAEGSAAFGGDAALQALDITLHSADAAPLAPRYLSGWLGQFGIEDLQLHGALDAQLHFAAGRLQTASAVLHDLDLVDPQGRFRFDGLDGDPHFSAGALATGTLRWRGGELYGLHFGAATLPLRSRNGALRLRKGIGVPAFGGSLRFDNLVLRPPSGETGMRMRFALTVDELDVGAIAKALDWPAFQGRLSGNIPDARYANERLDFGGGLTLQVFDGTVQVSSLSLERPFGVAPSLGADLELQDLDLEALTGVFDFGSIEGRLDGRIADLRLVDWTATAFDAELHTDADAARHADVKQRISQRAVQNISSVGDASFVTSLQGRLIGFFDDFGYRRIGISCKLSRQVCEMGGLHPAQSATLVQLGPVRPGSRSGFTIVEGAGIPRLSVVGYNRQVDWPTLLERLAAAGKGDVSPVVQ